MGSTSVFPKLVAYNTSETAELQSQELAEPPLSYSLGGARVAEFGPHFPPSPVNRPPLVPLPENL